VRLLRLRLGRLRLQLLGGKDEWVRLFYRRRSDAVEAAVVRAPLPKTVGRSTAARPAGAGARGSRGDEHRIHRHHPVLLEVGDEFEEDELLAPILLLLQETRAAPQLHARLGEETSAAPLDWRSGATTLGDLLDRCSGARAQALEPVGAGDAHALALRHGCGLGKSAGGGGASADRHFSFGDLLSLSKTA